MVERKNKAQITKSNERQSLSAQHNAVGISSRAKMVIKRRYRELT